MRIQYEISKEKNAELEKMMEKTDIKTKRDFINNAITLFNWAIKEREKGYIVGSLDEKEDKYREIIMPSLLNVKSASCCLE